MRSVDDGVEIPVRVDELTVADYVGLIQSQTSFAQANYGDGEWKCLLGFVGRNVNGEVYSPALAAALRTTLLSPVGQWCGTNPGRSMRIDVEAWVLHRRPKVRLVWKETLSAANVRGELAPFFRAVRERGCILVGPRHLTALNPDVIGHVEHILVPDATAWQDVDFISAIILEVVWETDIVLFAAGMATNLLIHRLRPMLPLATLLDVGAILDPYVGRFSRKGYRKPIFQERNMMRNLE